jgi:hypothetical protein
VRQERGECDNFGAATQLQVAKLAVQDCPWMFHVAVCLFERIVECLKAQFDFAHVCGVQLGQ